MRAVVALVLAVATAAVAVEPRFFVIGNGTLEMVNPALNETVQLKYLGPDGRYDYAAIDDLRHILRCKGDMGEGEITPRFVELLGHLYARTGRPLRLLSGYRSPSYNEGIRRRGTRAAFGSMHTEGLAADLAFPATSCCRSGPRARARPAAPATTPPRASSTSTRHAALLGLVDVARRRESLRRQRTRLRAHRLRPLHGR